MTLALILATVITSHFSISVLEVVLPIQNNIIVFFRAIIFGGGRHFLGVGNPRFPTPLYETLQ